MADVVGGGVVVVDNVTKPLALAARHCDRLLLSVRHRPSERVHLEEEGSRAGMVTLRCDGRDAMQLLVCFFPSVVEAFHGSALFCPLKFQSAWPQQVAAALSGPISRSSGPLALAPPNRLALSARNCQTAAAHRPDDSHLTTTSPTFWRPLDPQFGHIGASLLLLIGTLTLNWQREFGSVVSICHQVAPVDTLPDRCADAFLCLFFLARVCYRSCWGAVIGSSQEI